MKSEFKAKFLQQLIQKKEEEKGFTLIELLVVIIIIGILSAIALPSFLNQANKAKESEAKQYVGSMNRTQQAYFLEKNTFASDVSLLGLGIKTDSTNYSYAIQNVGNTAVANVSFPKNTTTLRAMTGGVQTGTTAGSEATTLAILCQSRTPSGGSSGGVSYSAASTSTGPSCQNGFDPLLN
jgi:prepilin-type N-terminal cleavage/methylation domain-containing protein